MYRSAGVRNSNSQYRSSVTNESVTAAQHNVLADISPWDLAPRLGLIPHCQCSVVRSGSEEISNTIEGIV